MKPFAIPIARHFIAFIFWVPVIAFAQGQSSAVPEQDHANLEERFNANFQATYISQIKPAFRAAYSGPNSLLPERESSYSSTITAYFGFRPWASGEIYFNPEMIQAVAFSKLHGLGGLTNAEQQKTSGPTPTFYRARLFLRQTVGLGGGQNEVDSGPNQLAGMLDKRRLVVTVGNLALIDIFDNNAFAHDPRTQFVNWSFFSHGAYDFAADARGYSTGIAGEYYDGDWVARVATFMGPVESNGLRLDRRITRHFGDQIELEHSHHLGDQPGKLRFLVFRNREVMGRFADAIVFAEINGGVPDVGNVRRENVKYGLGINLEQSLAPDMGLFARANWADGKSETYSFTEIESSLTAGIATKGNRWGRQMDTFGLAVAQNGLHQNHRNYLSLGGLGAFIGDGQLNYRFERILEAYYNFNVYKTTSVMLGYQRVVNPGYNHDRGPVNVGTLRLHTEF